MGIDALSRLEHEARAALVAGPTAPLDALTSTGASLEGRGPILDSLRAATERLVAERTPRAALTLAALTAQTRALASVTPLGATLTPLAKPERYIAPRPRPGQQGEVLDALNGQLVESEGVLDRALAFGALPDLLLLDAAIEALKRTRVASFVARRVLPAYGHLGLARLARGFDPRGGRSHAWRVIAACHGPDCAARQRLIERAFDEGAGDVPIAALCGATAVAPERTEAAALGALESGPMYHPAFVTDSFPNEDVEGLAYQALARCSSNAALEALLAGLVRVRSDFGWSAAAALRTAVHSRATQRLLEALGPALKAPRAGAGTPHAAAILYALAGPSHAAALGPLRALSIERRDAQLWYAHQHALAAHGDPQALSQLAALCAGPLEESVLSAIRSHSSRPFCEFARMVFAPASIATPAGGRAAERVVANYVTYRVASPREWAEVLVEGLAHPPLLKTLRRCFDAEHGRLFAHVDASTLYERLGGAVTMSHESSAANDRFIAAALGWVAQWPASAIDSRWADLAARHLSSRSLVQRAALELLVSREDPRAVPALQTLLAEDLKKRTRSEQLRRALEIYRPAALIDDLRARLGAAKPRSWHALYLERLVDAAQQPRFALAHEPSWITE